MSIESTYRPVHRHALIPALALAGLLACGCALNSAARQEAGSPVPVQAGTAAQDSPAADSVGAVLEFHQATRTLAAAELARQRATSAERGNSPRRLMERALLFSRPPGGNIARAIALLDAVLASDHPDAPALQPLARLLADQLLERHRLEAVNERLTVQLERTGQQLKDGQRHADELQEKLDALTEIERTLPARPPAATSPGPADPERRSPP